MFVEWNCKWVLRKVNHSIEKILSDNSGTDPLSPEDVEKLNNLFELRSNLTSLLGEHDKE